MIGDADLLEHADRGDLVELAFHLRKVLQDDLDPLLQAEARHLLARQRRLFLGQRHAGRLDAVMLRGMADQRAPAAADVEEAIARLQPQLAADHVELVRLRAGEIVVPVGLKVGAGIDHLGIEEEPVERVRDVVVVGDVPLVGGGLPVARRVLVDPVEGPRHVRGRAQEGERRLQRLDLARPLETPADLALRPLRGEVEDRAVLELEQARHMGVDQRVERSGGA